MANKDRAILLAAQELFGRKGYAGTTMKMIADKAGVAFGLVSHYFGTKEELFLAAGFDMVDSVLAAVRPELAKAENGLEAVRAFVSAYLAFTLENKATFPVLIRCSPFSDVETLVDRKRIAAKFAEIFAAIEDALARGMADGSVRELPVKATALFIFSNILGAVRTYFLTPFHLPGLFDETVKYVLRSVARPLEA